MVPRALSNWWDRAHHNMRMRTRKNKPVENLPSRNPIRGTGMRASHDSAQGRADLVISRRARPVHPVVKEIAENLSNIDVMRIVKVTPGLLQASSEICGARMTPVTKPGHPTAIGVSLILDEERQEIQFYEITSAIKGYGSRMMEAVVNALPRGWRAFVLMDWSEGFWEAMRNKHKQIVLE